MTSGAEVALRVDALTAGYGDLMAVRSVSLSVSKGQLVTMLGRNGAGKTSTILAIAGMLKPRGGRVELFDRDVTRSPVQDRIKFGLACVQEGRRIFRHRTVEENLLIATVPVRPSRRERSLRIEEMYGRFPVLASRRSETADRLSGGQQQLLAIAQALMSSPKVLLMDEPSAGLAPAVLDSVMQTIRDLKRDGLAVILVEQLVTRAVEEADFVAVLESGSIVYYGRAEDTNALDVAREVYMAHKPSVSLASILGKPYFNS